MQPAPPPSDKPLFQLKGSNSYLLGFLLFAVVGAGLGYFVFSDGLLQSSCNWAAGMFSTWATVDYLFWHKSQVVLTANEIKIVSGVRSRSQVYALSEILEVTIQLETATGTAERPLAEIDWATTDSKKIKELVLITKLGEKIELPSFGYDLLPYQRFLETFGLAIANGQIRLGNRGFLPTVGEIQPKMGQAPPVSEELQRIQEALASCQAYLATDRALAGSLQQNLLAAYQSVYQVHSFPEKDELAPFRPDVLHRQRVDGQWQCFIQGDLQPDVSHADLELANRLAEAAHQHLVMVQQRIKLYLGTQKELERSAAECRRRDKLRTIAGNLDSLQQTNAAQSEVDSGLSYELTSVEQWQKLVAELNAPDDLAKAEELKQYADLLKGHSGK